MGRAIEELLDMVKQSVLKHTDDQRHTGFDPTALLGQIEGLFGQHQAQEGRGQDGQRNVRPASEDPYGDPADQPARRH